MATGTPWGERTPHVSPGSAITDGRIACATMVAGSTLWVPNRSSTSGDLGIFVDQPAEPVAASEAKAGR